MNFKMNKIIVAGLVAIAAIGIFVAWQRSAPSFRCPNDYVTAEEYVTGVTEWARGELINSPNMTKDELAAARQKLFDEHKCTPSRWPSIPGGF